MADIDGEIRILLVEDNPLDEQLVRLALSMDKERVFDIAAVDTLAAAVGLVQVQTFQAIILDLHLPDSDGLANVKQLALAAPHTPIVVLTVCDEDAMAIEASRHGVQNYLVKGKSEPSRLSRHLRCAIAHKAFEAELAQRAHFDSLTGLVNRGLFIDRLGHALTRAERADKRVGVLFIDLDSFKLTNDAYGHAVGDEVLRMVAQSLRRAVRQGDTVARMGGDEFTILLEQVESRQQVQRIAEKVLAVAAQPVLLASGPQIQVTASIGVAVFPDDGKEPKRLLDCADTAMLSAKRRGGNQLLLPVQA